MPEFKVGDLVQIDIQACKKDGFINLSQEYEVYWGSKARITEISSVGYSFAYARLDTAPSIWCLKFLKLVRREPIKVKDLLGDN